MIWHVLTAITAGVSAIMPVIVLQLSRNKAQLNEIHVLVNSALHDMTSRATRSENALSTAGLQIPDSPEGTAPLS